MNRQKRTSTLRDTANIALISIFIAALCNVGGLNRSVPKPWGEVLEITFLLVGVFMYCRLNGIRWI